MDAAEVKEIYNRQVKTKLGGDYEHRRWFSDALKEAGYQMTKRAIEFHLFCHAACLQKTCFPLVSVSREIPKQVRDDESEIPKQVRNDARCVNRTSFYDYLELGSGAGTWTKLFLEKCPDAKFDLVDISGEMLDQAKENLGSYQNIRYFEADFLDFKPDKQYDLFFSSRALEYVPDKKRAVLKIAGLLRSGGRGFIITKTPKYLRARVFGRKIPRLHQGQIAPRKLKQLLSEAGFKNIAIYPATMSFPLFKSPKLNRLLFKVFYKHGLNFLSEFFSESYCVKFEK